MFKGLLEFLNCPLHIMHSAFRKLITNLRETAEQLAFDLHAWFKLNVDTLCQLYFKYVKVAAHLRTKFSLVTNLFIEWKNLFLFSSYKEICQCSLQGIKIWKFLQIALTFCDIFTILKSVNPWLSSKYIYACMFWANQDFLIL